MNRYLVVKGNTVLKELNRKNKLTSKQQTHILHKLNQQFPEAEISIAKITMSVFTPFFQVQR